MNLPNGFLKRVTAKLAKLCMLGPVITMQCSGIPRCAMNNGQNC